MPIIYKNSFLEEIDEPEEVPRSISVPAFLAGSRSFLPEAHMVEQGSHLGSNEIGSQDVSTWADVEFEDDEFEDEQRFVVKGLDHCVLSATAADQAGQRREPIEPRMDSLEEAQVLQAMAVSELEEQSRATGLTQDGNKKEIVKLFPVKKPGLSDASLRSTSKRATHKAQGSKCKASKVKGPVAKTSKAFQDKRPHLPSKIAVSSDWWQHASMKCSRPMASKEEMEYNECWICGSAYCRPSECQHNSAPAMREGRFKKRRQTIDTIKSKLHYIIYMQNVAKDQRTIRSPMTPPAEDIYDIPTRLWKRMTLEWDKQLKQREWGLDAIHIEPESGF